MSKEPTAREFADSLRKVADFYDKHPAIDVPISGEVLDLPIYKARAENMGLFRQAFLRATGYVEKRYGDPFFSLVAKFGCIELRAVEYREKICVRKVVGTETKRTERQVPIAYKTEIVEEVIEKVEWDCRPLAESTVEPVPDGQIESGQAQLVGALNQMEAEEEA